MTINAMKKIVQHIDGWYVREWKAGRKKIDPSEKSQHKTISLSPQANEWAKQWELITGQNFSSWVDDQIYKRVCIETV
jgi:hypothetical protein